MDSFKYLIREAQKTDMKRVFQMIQNLAQFEKLEDQVKIDEKILEKDGFDSENPSFHCLVAEADGSVIGYALYFSSYSTWEGKSILLEDLFVDVSYRKKGVGKELFLRVAKIAFRNYNRLDFHVLSWNPAVKFYKSLGAVDLTVKEDWHYFRMDKNCLNQLFNK